MKKSTIFVFCFLFIFFGGKHRLNAGEGGFGFRDCLAMLCCCMARPCCPEFNEARVIKTASDIAISKMPQDTLSDVSEVLKAVVLIPGPVLNVDHTLLVTM